MKRILSVGKGFTIVELVIVVAVVGILATIVGVSYAGITQSAREKAMLSDADAIASELAHYAFRNGGTYGPAVEWFSGAGSNPNIAFTPSEDNVVDVVANDDTYCIRVYNPKSNATTIQQAIRKGNSPQACLLLDASVAAGGTGGKIAGWWKLNGSTVDSSGFGRHGTAHGATPTQGANGEPNGAYQFSTTTNQWIDTPYNFPFNRLTVSVWAKWAGASPQSYGAIISNSRDCCAVYNGFQIHTSASNGAIGSRLWAGEATPAGSMSTGAYTAGAWQHIVLTYDGAQARLYIDGVQKGTTNFAKTLGSSVYNVSIGKGGWSTASYSFGGDIDDARIYDYALSASDVSELYKLGAQ